MPQSMKVLKLKTKIGDLTFNYATPPTVLKIDSKGQLSTTGKRWPFSNIALCGTLFLWNFKISTASGKILRKPEKSQNSNGFINN